MAARKKKVAPRKQPRQERAHATVDAILQAAAYILVRRGWEGLTTNLVAERAGVNIASLYQYFPNKEAIVVELQRRHVAQARARFPEALPALRQQKTLRSMLQLMVQAGVEEHRVEPALHRVFSEELPRSARSLVSGDDGEMERNWLAAAEPFLRNVPDVSLAVFICRVAVHAIIHEAAVQRPELLEHPRLVGEIVTLLDRYLRRPAPRGEERRRE